MNGTSFSTKRQQRTSALTEKSAGAVPHSSSALDEQRTAATKPPNHADINIVPVTDIIGKTHARCDNTAI